MVASLETSVNELSVNDFHNSWIENSPIKNSCGQYQNPIRVRKETFPNAFDFYGEITALNKRYSSLFNQMCYKNGVYDEDGHRQFLETDVAKEFTSASFDNFLKKIAHNDNLKIERKITSHLECLSVTRSTYDSALHIAKKMVDICKESGKHPTEVAMMMYGYIDKKSGTLIHDGVFIPKQYVTPTACTIDEQGFKESVDYAIDNKRAMSLWTHSHQYMDAFHSSTDTFAIHQLLRSAGTSVNVGERCGKDISMKLMYGLVVNAKSDAPATRVVANKPRWIVKEGRLELIYETVDFESVPKFGHMQHWPKLHVVESENTVDTDMLEEQLYGVDFAGKKKSACLSKEIIPVPTSATSEYYCGPIVSYAIKKNSLLTPRVVTANARRLIREFSQSITSSWL